MSNGIANKESTEIVYEASGQEIKLSPTIVSQFITKGNGEITDQEAVNFMMLCKYAELNPFLNEAYLVKFGSQPAQMITSKEAFMKRAERQPTYAGNQAGIVVMDKDGEIIEREGTIKAKNEELLGGWAKVYRSDRDAPTYISINFEEFAKYKANGNLQATWQQMPANMIRKSALVNALREAYPDQLGAMYTEDEPDIQNDTPRKNVTQEENGKTQSLLEEFNKSKPNSEEDKETSGPEKETEKEVEQDEVSEEIVVADFEEVEEENKDAAESEKETKEIDWSHYSDQQIKNSLDNRNIEYDAGARRDELIETAEKVVNGGVQSELF